MTTTLRLATDHASGDCNPNPAHVEEILADIRRALPYGAQTQIERRTGIPAGTIQDQLVRVGPNGRRGALLREVIEWQHTYRPSIESGGRANPAALADTKRKSRFLGEPGAASAGHVSARRS